MQQRVPQFSDVIDSGLKKLFSRQFDVFNRWGNKLFSTTNPDILWDGNDASSGNKLPDGVYFYVCDVEEIRLDNNVTRTLKGTITLFGNSSKNGN